MELLLDCSAVLNPSIHSPVSESYYSCHHIQHQLLSSLFYASGFWDYSYYCNNPWKTPPESCDLYEGQKAGRFDNTAAVANRAGRTDVEGCCWYGCYLYKSIVLSTLTDVCCFLNQVGKGSYSNHRNLQLWQTKLLSWRQSLSRG